MGKSEENKALMRKLMSVFANGDSKIIDECLSPEIQIHQYHFPKSIQTIRGTGALKKFLPDIRKAFPDLKVEFEDQIAEEDRVASRITFTGTHKGKIMDILPTNRHIVWTGIFIFRIKDNQIVETWGNWDLYGILEQMGILSSRVSLNPFELGAFPKKVL